MARCTKENCFWVWVIALVVLCSCYFLYIFIFAVGWSFRQNPTEVSYIEALTSLPAPNLMICPLSNNYVGNVENFEADESGLPFAQNSALNGARRTELREIFTTSMPNDQSNLHTLVLPSTYTGRLEINPPFEELSGEIVRQHAVNESIELSLDCHRLFYKCTLQTGAANDSAKFDCCSLSKIVPTVHGPCLYMDLSELDLKYHVAGPQGAISLHTTVASELSGYRLYMLDNWVYNPPSDRGGVISTLPGDSYKVDTLLSVYEHKYIRIKYAKRRRYDRRPTLSHTFKMKNDDLKPLKGEKPDCEMLCTVLKVRKECQCLLPYAYMLWPGPEETLLFYKSSFWKKTKSIEYCSPLNTAECVVPVLREFLNTSHYSSFWRQDKLEKRIAPCSAHCREDFFGLKATETRSSLLTWRSKGSNGPATADIMIYPSELEILKFVREGSWSGVETIIYFQLLTTTMFAIFIIISVVSDSIVHDIVFSCL